MAKERWRPAPGIPHYEISDHGNLRRADAGKGARAGHVIKGWVKPSGHRTFSIRREGKTINVRASRLVAIAFIGSPPFDGAEVCHRDGQPSHDYWRNLRWGTSASNKADMVKHGTWLWGEKHANARLTAEQVKQIRARYVRGKSPTQRELAEEYGVGQVTISRIVLGKRWVDPAKRTRAR